MALLDSVIREIEERFGLGKKSAGLIAEVVQYLFDPKQGGFSGFIDRFKSAGLGDIVASWVAKGRENLPVTAAQLESALGSGIVNRLGSSFSLAGSTVRNVLAFALPRLVDALTPDGVIPKAIPADVQSFLNSAAAKYRPKPAATSFGENRDTGGIGPWAWLAAALWSALLAYWALSGSNNVASPEVAAVQPKASLPARLALSNNDGKVEFSGVVGDEKTRTSVLDLLKGVFGEPNISGKVDVDPRVGPATWLPNLGALLKQFNLPGADLLLEGNGLKIGGWLSDADRSNWLNSIKGLFGSGFSFGFLGDKTAEAVKSAYDKTVAALDSLKPGYGVKDVAEALNLWVINFETDSAAIPLESQPLIDRAAKAIAAAPDAVVIEIAGHTDNTGDAATNQVLSEKRATSVRDALVAAGVPEAKLQAKGYGQDRPVATNDTAYGRFHNRRIEFKVQE